MQLLNLPGIPRAVDHPLWQDWFARTYAEDRRPYGAHTHLHHYVSSYEALMSILASQTLWASDIRSLKDTTEFEHGIPICNDALGLIRDAHLRQHVYLAKQGLAERFRHRTFVSCFSTRPNLQFQWETYADEQRGFLISFESLVISNLASPQGYMLMPVEYGRDAQADRARRAVVRAIDDLNGALPGLSVREVTWTIQSRFVLLASELFFFCASFKAPKFRQEHEWRLIYSRHRDESGALAINRRTSTERAIDYVVIDLNRRYDHQRLPSVAAIRVGPRATDNVVALVRAYAKDYGNGVRVELQPSF
jgi:hypothetical protein